MLYQLRLFFTALQFFTRLPVPAWVGFAPEWLNHSARYFSAVGWVVGAVGAAAAWGLALVLPWPVALLLSMAATLRITGAFHEDGFADACDGFGGGWSKLQVMTIMKDSRIGSYGTAGMLLMLATKFACLFSMGATGAALALLAAHPLSRLASTALIRQLEYVRDEDGSKSKPLAVKLANHELAIAALFGLLPLALLPWQALPPVLLLVALVTWRAAAYFVRRIGGYTGDCLGAVQQLTEVACYLGILLSWKFI